MKTNKPTNEIQEGSKSLEENETRIKQDSLSDIELITQISIELSSITLQKDLIIYITKKLKELTGASIVSFSEYNLHRNALVIRHLEAEDGLVELFNKLANIDFSASEITINDDIYQKVTNNIVNYIDDFRVLIPTDNPELIQNIIFSVIGLKKFLWISYTIQGELYGISYLGYKQHIEAPNELLLKSYAAIIAGAIKRHRAEQELRESEIKYGIIVNNTPNIVFVHQCDKILFMNNNGLKSLGISKDSFQSKTIYDFLYGDSKERVRAHLSKKNIEHNISNVELDIIANNHQIKRMVLTSSLINYKNERAFLVVLTDLSERLKNENILKASEEKHRNMIENIQDIFYQSDMNGNLTMINANGLKILGYDYIHEILNKPILETFYINKEDRIPYLKELELNGRVVDYELRLKRKDESEILVSANSHYYYDENGKVIGIEGVLRDLTDSKKKAIITQTNLAITQFAIDNNYNDFIKFAIDQICNITFSRVGFFYLVDNSSNTIQLNSCSTNASNLYYSFNTYQHYDINSTGSLSQCIFSRKTIIINDYNETINNNGIFKEHGKILRKMIIPIFRHEQIVAIIELANKPYNYLQSDLEIVELFANIIWEIIERKKAESALSLTNSQLQMIADNVVDVIWNIDIDLMIKYVSRSAELMFGWSIPEWENLKIEDYVCENSLAKIRRIFVQEYEYSQSQNYDPYHVSNFELEFKRKNGSHFWGELTARANFDANHTFIGFTGVTRDITNQKLYTEKLSQDLQRSKNQQEIISAISTLVFSENNNIKKLFETITEITAKKLGVSRVSVWVFSDDTRELKMVDLYELDKATHSEGFVLLKDDIKAEFETIKYTKYIDVTDPINDPRTSSYADTYIIPFNITSLLDAMIKVANKYYGLLSIEFVNQEHSWEQDEIVFICQLVDQISIAILNIERQKAEIELKAISRMQKAILENAEYAIIACDLDGIIKSVNPATEKMLGYNKEELLNNCLFTSLVSKPELNSKKIQLSTQLGYRIESEFDIIVFDAKKGFASEQEWCLQKKNGVQIPVILSTSTLKNDSVNSDGFLFIAVDISYRKTAELELKESEEKFRMLIEQSTEGMFVVDNQSNIVEWNNKMYQFLGISKNHVINKPLKIVKQILINVDIRNDIDSFINIDRFISTPEELYNLKTEQEHIAKLYFPNDIIKYFQLVTFPIKTNKGNFVCFIIRDNTEITLINESLRKSQESYRNMIEYSPLGIHFYEVNDNNDIILLDANPAADNILNLNHKLYYGKNINEFYPKSFDVNVINNYINVALEGKTWNTEYILYHDENIYRAFDIRTFQISKRKIVIMFMDITERKNADISIKISEEKYHSLFSNSALAVILVNMEGKFLDFNEAYLNMVGYTREELFPMNFKDITLSDDVCISESALEKLFTSNDNKTIRYEKRYIHKDGHVVWGDVSIKKINSKTGNTMFILATILDITQKKEQEEIMIKNEEKYLLLEENISDVILMISFDMIITHVSASLEKMTGYEPKEWIGKEFLRFINPVYIDEIVEIYKQKIELLSSEQINYKDTFTFEISLQRKNNGFFWAEISSKYLIDDTANAIGFIASIRDSTERKNSELQKNKLVEQLAKTQIMESIGRLSGGVAHDLNNTLTPILGYAEVLLKELEFDLPKKTHIQQIINGVLNARDLIRQLLAFASKQTLDMKPININNAITDMQNLLEHAFPDNIKINIILDDNIKLINADKIQIQQIIMNLCLNSKDAMADGGIINIETQNINIDELNNENQPLFETQNPVLLSISDSGVGFDNETKARIFEPFYTTKGLGKGTGLGLATVHGIVKQHGGHIILNSEINKGTKFDIYFPAL